MPITHDAPRPGAQSEVRPGTPTANPALRGPILLATDGSGQSGAPLIAAQLLSQHLGVPLEIVSVLETQTIYDMSFGGTAIYLPELDELRRASCETAVRDYVTRFSVGAAPPTIHTRFGSIADEIAQVARERNATLIIVGAAPHQRVNRIIAGERAAHVLRSSSVPVLSVPPGFSELPENILVAVDFAPASVRAAETALLLLAKGGTLTLLHVLFPFLGDAPLRDMAGRDPANAVQTLFGRVRDELRPYVPDDVTIETRVTTDYDVDGIIAGASDVGADLVAVGTHGPRLLERILVGSVASSVLHSAPEAVLAAPPPPAAEALELWLRIAGTGTSKHPREWSDALDDFTKRNSGRGATIEVDDPDVGAQMLGRGSLAGVTFDPHDQRVEIMLGETDRTRRHLMHSIPNVTSIGITADERGGSEVLELRHGRGHTLVLVAR